MNIYLIMQNEQDYREIISVPISAHPTRQQAEAEAARLDLDAAWASNQPDYDGGGLITHHVYEIPLMSTPVDIAPLPDPPSEIYLPLSADEFLKLVRDGKVQVETPSGDTTIALVDRASVGWARIGWDYELGDDNEWVAYHDSTVIDELTVFQRVDHKVSANGVTFIIEEL